MGETVQGERCGHIIAWLVGVIAVVATGFALKATKIVTMPLALSFFLVILVYPFYRRISALFSPRLKIIPLFLTMLLIVAVVAFFVLGIWFSGAAVARKFPEYTGKLAGFQERLIDLADRNGIPVPAELPRAGKGGGMVGKAYVALIASFYSFVELLVIVFFLVLLALLEMGEWKTKVKDAFPGMRAGRIVDSLRIIAVKVRTYIIVHTIISAVSAGTAMAWLLLMGVDFALAMGFLTFFLNYLPYIGSVIAVFPPSAIALLQKGPAQALVVLIGLSLIDQVMGNYVDPYIKGKKLVISPTVIFVSLIFWGWAWGAVGAFLAVPLTITTVITCDHVPSLKPFARLLSRAPEGK